jgi:hypothetical protein
MSVLSLPKILRAAVVSVALAGAVFTAMPAQAQSVEFRFGGPGFNVQFGDGRLHCLSNREVRRDLRQDGYREIRFFDRRGRIVQLTAERRNRDYEIAYDTCRGRIVDRDRI